MKNRIYWQHTIYCLIIFLLLGISNAFAKELVVGMLLAGSHKDNSYNAFHLNAALQAAETVKNVKIIYIEQANPLVRPAEVTIPVMVDDLVQKGATVIIANTYEMELGIVAAAPHYPNVTFIQINGDETLNLSAHANIINLSLMFEYAQFLAGFASGMASSGGKIGYLATSPNAESYRQISAAYLGAKYAWTEIRGLNPKDFHFRLKWMGNWFDNLSPLDDTKSATLKLFNEGADVVMGGNYKTDIIAAANAIYRNNNKKLLITAVASPHIPQSNFPFIVGLSYFNWRPAYVDLFLKLQQGALTANWIRLAPDLAYLSTLDGSSVGFMPFSGLDANGKKELAKLVDALAKGNMHIFRGPLKFKDGSVFLEVNQLPTTNMLLNMNQLVEGIEEIPYMPVTNLLNNN